MTIDIQPVQPGDLITASFVNGLINALHDLDTRLDVLEHQPLGSPPQQQSGSIAVDSVTPGTATEGDTVTIAGANFGPTVGDSFVTFDNVPPVQIVSWSGSTIVCKVPTIPSLHGSNPPNSVSVAVQVSNFVTSATRFITVKPFLQQQSGSFEVQYKDASPDPVTANTDNLFEFTVKSLAALQTNVTLTPTLTGAGWAPVVLDDSQQPLPGNQLTIASGATKTFYVKVPIPSNTNGTAFTVEVNATATGVQTGAANISLTVGQNADPDTTFTLSPTSVSGGTLSGSTVSVKFGDEADIFMDAEFTVAGSYDVSLATVPQAPSNWAIDLANPAPDSQGHHVINVSSQDIANAVNGRVPQTVDFSAIPSAGATDIQLRLVVQNENAANANTFTFDIHPHA